MIKINHAERALVRRSIYVHLNGWWWYSMTGFLTAAEAAQRLGVKPATLYAYVSRGVLRRDKTPGGRGSLFDSDEVERLARRGRPRPCPGSARRG